MAEQVVIWLRAAPPDKSKEEAMRLLKEGGEVRDLSVLERIAELIPEGDPKVIFKRVAIDFEVLTFSSHQIVCAMGEKIDPRPLFDFQIPDEQLTGAGSGDAGRS